MKGLFKKIEDEGIKSKGLKYIFITFGGECLPIAWKLKKEGKTVIVGMIDSNKDILTKSEIPHWREEDPENKQKRFELYANFVEKYDAKAVIEWAKTIKNKDEWFVFSDINNTFKYMDQLREMGFTGLMPTEQERELERDRKLAKDFVEKHYKGLEVAENIEYDTIDEAITFLEEAEDLWVLKPKGEVGKTIVPRSNDPFMDNQILIDVLQSKKKDYETNGFILEKKIINVKEITPEIVFWNGKPVFSTIDIESKPLADGDIGCQTGCSKCLVFKTDLDCELNKLAFPPVVYEMAKKHKGMFVWDASIYFDKDGNKYFGEFCANRVGWDSIFAQLSMAGSVSDFFEKVKLGKNPLDMAYSATVRIFNVLPDGKMMEDGLIQFYPEIEDYVWIYDLGGKEERMVSCAYTYDTAVITGCGEDAEEAIKDVYDNIAMFSFEADFHRTKDDFLSKDYQTAIMVREEMICNSGLI